MKIAMKTVKIALMMLFVTLALASCNKDDKKTTLPEHEPLMPEVIDIANPDLLSAALYVADANLGTGKLPNVTMEAGISPEVSSYLKHIFTKEGHTFFLQFNFKPGDLSDATYAGCKLQVAGSSMYFDIPSTGQKTGVKIPIELPSKLTGDSFYIHYVVYDTAGKHSEINRVKVILEKVTAEYPNPVSNPSQSLRMINQEAKVISF